MIKRMLSRREARSLLSEARDKYDKLVAGTRADLEIITRIREACNQIRDIKVMEIKKQQKNMHLESAFGRDVDEGLCKLFRLNLDMIELDRTCGSMLITALSAYIRMTVIKKAYDDLYESIREIYETTLNEAMPEGDMLAWKMSTDEEKEKANQACVIINEWLEGDFGHFIDEAHPILKELMAWPAEEALKDYKSNPLAFEQALFETVPEMTSGMNKKSTKGFPGDVYDEMMKAWPEVSEVKIPLMPYQEDTARFMLQQKTTLLTEGSWWDKAVAVFGAMEALTMKGCKQFAIVTMSPWLACWRHWLTDLGYRVAIYSTERGQQEMADLKSQGGVLLITYDVLPEVYFSDADRPGILVADGFFRLSAQDKKVLKGLVPQTDRVLLFSESAPLKAGDLKEWLDLLHPAMVKRMQGAYLLYNEPGFSWPLKAFWLRHKYPKLSAELPDYREITYWCAMGPDESANYRSLVSRGLYTAARQTSFSAAYIEGETNNGAKYDILSRIYNDCTCQQRVMIIVSAYTDTLYRLADYKNVPTLPVVDPMLGQEANRKTLGQLGVKKKTLLLIEGSDLSGLTIRKDVDIVFCEPAVDLTKRKDFIQEIRTCAQGRRVCVRHILLEGTVDEWLNQSQKAGDVTEDMLLDYLKTSGRPNRLRGAKRSARKRD